MKWLFISAAAALSLAVTTPAWTAPDPLSGPGSGPQAVPYGQRLAQNDQQRKDKHGGQGAQKNQIIYTDQQIQRQQPPQNQAGGAKQQQQLQRQQTQQNQAVRANQQQRQQLQRQQTQQNRAVRTNQQQQQQLQRQQPQRQQAQRQQRYNWSSYQQGRRPPDWNNHRNFDRGAWQRNEQAQRRYHWNSYQRPPGWYYRRWSFGMILPSLFWGRQYWIDGYWNYGLPDPPYGYVWVRYGNDALLVNVEDGDILRVIYGLYD